MPTRAGVSIQAVPNQSASRRGCKPRSLGRELQTSKSRESKTTPVVARRQPDFLRPNFDVRLPGLALRPLASARYDHKLQASLGTGGASPVSDEPSKAVDGAGYSFVDALIHNSSKMLPAWVVLGCVIAVAVPDAVTSWFSSYPWMTELALSVSMVGVGWGLSSNQGAGRMVLASMILGLLLQWTVVPTLATGIARVAALPADFPAGLLLAACCSGGAAATMLAYVAKANTALALGATAISVVAAPLLASSVASRLAGAAALEPLLRMQLERVLLPAAAGIFLNSLFWQTAGLGKSVDAVSRLAAVVSIAAYAASVLAANAGALTLCSPMLAGCVTAVHAGGFALGYLVPLALGFTRHQACAISFMAGMQIPAVWVMPAEVSSAIGALSVCVQSIAGSCIAALWLSTQARNLPGYGASASAPEIGTRKPSESGSGVEQQMAAEAEEKDGTTAGESGALKRRAATSPQRLAAAKGGAAQVKQWMWRKGQTDGSTPKEAARGGAPSPDRLQDDAATVVAILPEAEAVAAESRGGAAAARSWIDAWKRQQSGYGSRPQGSSAAAPTVKQAESAAATPTSSKSNMPENLKSSWGETHAEAAKAGSKGMKDDFEAIEKGLASSAETFNAAGSSLVESISSEAGSPRYSASDAEARASEARAWISFWRRKQEIAANAAEARRWIESWRARKAAAAAAGGTSEPMGTMSTADGPALVDKAMAILQPPRAMSLPARSDMEQGLQEASSTIGRSLSQGFKSFGQEVSDSIDVLKSAIGKAASNVKEPRKGGDSNEKSEEGVASGAAQQSAREWIAAWRNRQD